MDWLTIALRIGHIFSGVAWVGGALIFIGFLLPTSFKLGPDAEKFVDELVNRRRLPRYFLTVSTATVVFGLLLYWRDSNGLNATWIGSPSGLGFTIGGAAAGIAWAVGNVMLPRLVGRLGQLGAEAKAAGGPPSPQLMAAILTTRQRLRTIGAALLGFLGIALLGMASARYLG